MKLVLWGGLVLMIGSVILIVSNYKYMSVEYNGSVVKMEIIEMPNSCLGTRIKHFTTLSYNNETFVKRIGGEFCDTYNVGEWINVRYLKGYSVVLFPEESVLNNLISFGVLGLLGVMSVVYYLRKTRV